MSLELGTLSSMRVFMALRAENWLHHHGGRENPRAEKIKAELLRAFYPDTTEWKSKIWIQGRDVVEQALIKLK